MIITILVTLAVLAALLGAMAEHTISVRGEIYTSSIKGLMVGVLYNEEAQQAVNTESDEVIDTFYEHTLQICLFFVTFTFVWQTDYYTEDYED